MRSRTPRQSRPVPGIARRRRTLRALVLLGVSSTLLLVSPGTAVGTSSTGPGPEPPGPPGKVSVLGGQAPAADPDWREVRQRAKELENAAKDAAGFEFPTFDPRKVQTTWQWLADVETVLKEYLRAFNEADGDHRAQHYKRIREGKIDPRILAQLQQAVISPDGAGADRALKASLVGVDPATSNGYLQWRRFWQGGEEARNALDDVQAAHRAVLAFAWRDVPTPTPLVLLSNVEIHEGRPFYNWGKALSDLHRHASRLIQGLPDGLTVGEAAGPPVSSETAGQQIIRLQGTRVWFQGRIFEIDEDVRKGRWASIRGNTLKRAVDWQIGDRGRRPGLDYGLGVDLEPGLVAEIAESIRLQAESRRLTARKDEIPWLRNLVTQIDDSVANAYTQYLMGIGQPPRPPPQQRPIRPSEIFLGFSSDDWGRMIGQDIIFSHDDSGPGHGSAFVAGGSLGPGAGGWWRAWNPSMREAREAFEERLQAYTPQPNQGETFEDKQEELQAYTPQPNQGETVSVTTPEEPTTFEERQEALRIYLKPNKQAFDTNTGQVVPRPVDEGSFKHNASPPPIPSDTTPPPAASSSATPGPDPWADPGPLLLAPGLVPPGAVPPPDKKYTGWGPWTPERWQRNWEAGPGDTFYPPSMFPAPRSTFPVIVSFDVTPIENFVVKITPPTWPPSGGWTNPLNLFDSVLIPFVGPPFVNGDSLYYRIDIPRLEPAPPAPSPQGVDARTGDLMNRVLEQSFASLVKPSLDCSSLADSRYGIHQRVGSAMLWFEDHLGAAGQAGNVPEFLWGGYSYRAFLDGPFLSGQTYFDPTDQALTRCLGGDPDRIAWFHQSFQQGLTDMRTQGLTALNELNQTRITLTPQQVQAVRDALAALENSPHVDVSPDPPRQTEPAPRDPYFHSVSTWGQGYPDQWALPRIGLTGDADSAWELEDGSTSPVVVAVIDTGLDWGHPDISPASLWRNPKEIPDNGLDDDGNGYVDDIIGWNFVRQNNLPWDYDGHGTFVTGIIAAGRSNAVGITGISSGAKIMVLKAMNDFGRSRASYLAEAIVYAADKGARIINISAGGEHLTPVEQEAVDYADRKGALVVVAAGNQGIETANYSPAGLARVLTVAATGLRDERAPFSNWGRKIEIAAPGVDILSLRARRTDIMLRSKEYQPGSAYVGDDKRYYRASGTSFAAPMVAGVAALIMSRDPTLTHHQVRRMLVQSARDIETPGRDNFTGYGLLTARAALEAPPAFFVDAEIVGVSVVQTAGRLQVRVTGTADADRLKRAWLELGPGKAPQSWKRVSADITQPVKDGVLADVEAGHFRGAKTWTLRIITEHETGRQREAWFVLNLG